MTSRLFDADVLLNYLQTVSGEAVADREAVSLVLTLVYQCSLYKEEKREVRCRVIIVRTAKDDKHLDLLRFLKPVPINVASLRRLALATVSPSSALVINCVGGEPVLVGCATEDNLATYFHSLGISSPPYEVVCLGPGLVEVSANGSTVRFARDKYVIPELYKAASCAIPAVSQADLVRRAAFPGILGWINYTQGHGVGVLDPPRFGMYHDTFQAEAPLLATFALKGYTVQLVQNMRTIGAGGSLLILPVRELSSTNEYINGYAIGKSHERFRGELWNAGLINVFEWLLHVRMASLDKLVLCVDDGCTAADWIANKGKDGIARAEEIRNSDAERVARLSAIDGALVVNSILSPVMFGAKFQNVDTSGLPEPTQNFLSTRGMRHRAMAATVNVIRNAGGIVVSQDGDVTVFSNVDGVLCCHHEEVEIDTVDIPVRCAHFGMAAYSGLPEWLMDVLSGGEASRYRSSNEGKITQSQA